MLRSSRCRGREGLTEEDHVREVILVSGREKEEVAPEVDQEDPGLEIDYEDPDQEKGSVRDLVKEEDQGLGKEEGQGQGTGEGLRDLDQEIGKSLDPKHQIRRSAVFHQRPRN